MELKCENNGFRLLFTQKEVTSGLLDRAQKSLWGYLKVNPKVLKTELRYTVYQVSENRIKNWFDLFDRVWGKEKAFPGGNPRKAKKK